MNASFLTLFAEAEGKPVEFLRTGKFKDMTGKLVEITSEKLDKIVAGFVAGEAGQDVPIDIMHKREESAGWIKSVWREQNKLLAAVDWNALGQGLVKEKIYRYLSATINLASDILVSISLVNFPAVKGLAAVELGEESETILFVEEDESLQDHIDEVRQAWYQVNSDDYEQGWITEVGMDWVIVNKKGRFYQISYTEDATEGIKFDIENASAVKQAWVPDTAGLSSPNEEKEMKDEVKGAVADEEKAPVVTQPVVTPPAINLSEELTKARTELRAQLDAELATFKQGLVDEQKAWVETRNKVVGDVMAQLREEQDVARFAETVTSTGKFALPVKPADLISFMTGLPAEARAAIRGIFEQIHQNGTVNFGETGTSAGLKADQLKKQLDSTTKKLLVEFQAEGGKLEEFFEMNADMLGKQEDWDL